MHSWMHQALPWNIAVTSSNTLFHDDFEPEVDALPPEVMNKLLACTGFLEEFGPQLGRPRVDTLKGSRHPNMKELRFSAANGEWRVAFAFDPNRQPVLLVAGDKSGISERRFYKHLIRKADARFDAWLATRNSKRARPGKHRT